MSFIELFLVLMVLVVVANLWLMYRWMRFTNVSEFVKFLLGARQKW